MSEYGCMGAAAECVHLQFAATSVFLVLKVWMFVCEAVDSRQASLLSFSSLPKSEAKRGKAAPFNRGAGEKMETKGQN